MLLLTLEEEVNLEKTGINRLCSLSAKMVSMILSQPQNFLFRKIGPILTIFSSKEVPMEVS